MKIISALVITLLFCICISARTVNLSDYTAPNDGENDSVGFQNAVGELQEKGGGTLIVSDGTWNLMSPINLMYPTTMSIKIVGDKGAIIQPALSPGQTLFNAGNLNQLEIRDLIFVGDRTSAPDFGYLLVSSYVDQTKITGCQFFGLRASESLIYVGNTDAVIEDSLFLGISSRVANIAANDFRGLTINHSQFIDYGNLGGLYYSKTPYGNGAWVKVDGGPNRTASALSQRTVVISDSRFDEGARYAIDASNISFLTIRGVMTNVSGMGDSAGVKMNAVDFAQIEQSKFGYVSAPRPALIALNNSKVLFSGLTIENGVYYGEEDGTSQIHFDERFCNNCTINASRPRK